MDFVFIIKHLHLLALGLCFNKKKTACIFFNWKVAVCSQYICLITLWSFLSISNCVSCLIIHHAVICFGEVNEIGIPFAVHQELVQFKFPSTLWQNGMTPRLFLVWFWWCSKMFWWSDPWQHKTDQSHSVAPDFFGNDIKIDFEILDGIWVFLCDTFFSVISSYQIYSQKLLIIPLKYSLVCCFAWFHLPYYCWDLIFPAKLSITENLNPMLIIFFSPLWSHYCLPLEMLWMSRDYFPYITLFMCIVCTLLRW